MDEIRRRAGATDRESLQRLSQIEADQLRILQEIKNSGKEVHQFGEASIDATAFVRAQRFIVENLPVGPVPSVPEILLHRASARSGLWRLAEMDEDFDNPYWAYEWGGGLALARHVLDNPELVVGRRILDLGAGSGIVGIAAMNAGAVETIAADTDPYAMSAIDLNAAANGITVVPFLGRPDGSIASHG